MRYHAWCRRRISLFAGKCEKDKALLYIVFSAVLLLLTWVSSMLYNARITFWDIVIDTPVYSYAGFIGQFTAGERQALGQSALESWAVLYLVLSIPLTTWIASAIDNWLMGEPDAIRFQRGTGGFAETVRRCLLHLMHFIRISIPHAILLGSCALFADGWIAQGIKGLCLWTSQQAGSGGTITVSSPALVAVAILVWFLSYFFLTEAMDTFQVMFLASWLFGSLGLTDIISSTVLYYLLLSMISRAVGIITRWMGVSDLLTKLIKRLLYTPKYIVREMLIGIVILIWFMRLVFRRFRSSENLLRRIFFD